MKQITADDQELNALLQLLDAACRQAGIHAARPVAVWQQKINEAEEVKSSVTSLKPAKES